MQGFEVLSSPQSFWCAPAVAQPSEPVCDSPYPCAQGLGEMMPQQLWDTTLNPATRTLKRLTVQDAVAASQLFSLLMGDKVEPRRALIQAHGAALSIEDLDI